MKPKSRMPRKLKGSAAAATSVQPPFTRLDHDGRATTDEFHREGMGVAAKE